MSRKGIPDKVNLMDKAIMLSMSGRSWTEIATELDVHTSTVWQWRQRSDFRAKLIKAQETVLQETATQHSEYLSQAFQCLMEQINNRKLSPTIRQKAAELVITSTHRNVELLKIVEQNRKALEMLTNETSSITEKLETIEASRTELSGNTEKEKTEDNQ